MFSIVLIIIIAVFFVGVLFIVIKKLSHLAVIDVDSIPSEKAKKVEAQIISKRLKEKANKFYNVLDRLVKPVINRIKKSFVSQLEKLKELEKEYKTKKEPATKEEKIDIEQKIKKLLEEAEELTKQEEYAEAEKIYIETISLDEDNIEAFKGLGHVYLLQKNYEQAKETFEFILKIREKTDGAEKNGDAVNYFDLGTVCKEMGDNKEALKYFKKAHKLEENNPKYLDFLAESCIILGDKDQAKMYILKLKEANPDNNKIEEYEGKLGSL
jgi:tetratricopeptide (TPR) repeat protein